MIENLDEIEWVTACFDYYARSGATRAGSTIPPSFEHQVNFTVKEPFGVVAGDRAVQLPAAADGVEGGAGAGRRQHRDHQARRPDPLSTLRLTTAFDVLPPGVVGIVTGIGEEAGEALVRHPHVDMIAFTGSTRDGKHIMRLAADTLKKVNLETSGIDPSSCARTPTSTSRHAARCGRATSTPGRCARRPSASTSSTASPMPSSSASSTWRRDRGRGSAAGPRPTWGP
jgi:acyl-CoA reductase-like NAD-dependent aldehyde dehydrogenase